MKTLYLNTANKIVKLGLIIDEESTFSEFEQDNNLVENLMDQVEKFIKKNKISFDELTHIAVFRGPGGFTSLRIGIVTANTLARSLQLPIAEIVEKEERDLLKTIVKKSLKKDFVDLAKPFYGKEPNITKPKDRFDKNN